MSTIVTRSGKGSPLTHVEVDANFTNLNTDKYQSGDSVTFNTLTANSTAQFGRSSANYFEFAGAATTKTVEAKALGSDTNIAFTIDSKGTGAVNLAAGSSGVNISNGGTVTALTRTASGSGYTSLPSIAITAPTTAGGVQATASPLMGLAGATIVSGGTGYTVNDVLTISGTTGTAGQLTVSSVSAGVITGVTVSLGGNMSAIPTNPASVTGGTGSGATFTLTYSISSSVATITNAGSGYVEQPTVTFSGGGGSGAAAYASVGSTTTLKTIGNTLDVFTPAGRSFQVLNSPNSNPVSFIQVSPNSTGQPAYLAVGSSDTNASMWFFSKGTGSIDSWTGGGRQFLVSNTASAVNYVQVTGAATGGGPTLSVQGSDTNAGLAIRGKGSGFITLGQDSTTQFGVSRTASAVNYILATGGAAGGSPSFTSTGTDTNIDLTLTPKGTGLVRFGTYTAGAPTATGYISIKAADGTTYKVLVGT